MKALDWDDNLLKERRDRVTDENARAAFDYLVNAAMTLPGFECRPAPQGRVKTFSYKNTVTNTRDFAFIVNAKSLRFYVRPTGLKLVPGGFDGLRSEFVEAEPKSGEWIVQLFTLSDATRLQRFLFGTGADGDELQATLEDDFAETTIRNRPDIGELEKEQLIRARRGHGRFRQDLERIESGCRLTGISDRRHLRASHIKPWCKSDDQEKLDPNNGLLLAPHVDHLFDRGYISFSDAGNLLVAKTLDTATLAAWNLKSESNVGPFSDKQRFYLEYHRKEVFRKR